MGIAGLRFIRTSFRPTGLLLAAAILIFIGCGGSTDTVVVDFSVTLPDERPAPPGLGTPPLRLAVAAMFSPQETFAHYRRLVQHIGVRLGREIQLVQRKTYEEINALFTDRQIDLAFICSGPYVMEKKACGFEALAVPEELGSAFYQSYLIVHAESPFQSLGDLQGKIFAFTDPESNTGRLVPTYWLERLGQRPETFFRKTVHTYGHDNSILAVSRSLVDAAAVHGNIWEFYNRRNPEHTSRTRIIKRSEPFGNPPLVASASLPPRLKEEIRGALLGLHLDPEGRKILEDLMIDRFVQPSDGWYDPIRKMLTALNAME